MRTLLVLLALAFSSVVFAQQNIGVFGLAVPGSGSGSGITALTGDVSASGTGSVAATVNSYNGGTTFGTAAAVNTGTSGGTLGLLNGSLTFSAADTFSFSPGASASSVTLTGSPYTGGTATTNFPLFYLNSGAAPTTLNVAGTMLGINAPSGFTGNVLDVHVNGGASIFSMQSTGQLATGTIFSNGSIYAAGSSYLAWNGRNNIASPSSTSIQLGGNDAASPSAQTLRSQGVVAGTSNTAGVSFTILAGPGTGSGAGGSLIFQTAGTGAASTTQNTELTALTIAGGSGSTAGSVTVAGAALFPGLATSSAATTGTMCWTTSTGNVTVDTTLACLSSDEDTKQRIKALGPALPEVMAMRPIEYENKPGAGPASLGKEVGLSAQAMYKIDPRLVGLYGSGSKKGKPQGVRYMQLTAVLVKALQEQQAEIGALQGRVSVLEGKVH